MKLEFNAEIVQVKVGKDHSPRWVLESDEASLEQASTGIAFVAVKGITPTEKHYVKVTIETDDNSR